MLPNIHSIKLKKFRVILYFDDEEYGIMPEHMVQFETTNSIYSIINKAKLTIADNIEISDKTLFNGDGKVKVEFEDVFNNNFKYEFKIVNTRHALLGNKDPILVFDIIDKNHYLLYYNRGNGQGFNDTIPNILSVYNEFNINFNFKIDEYGDKKINYVYPMNKNLLYTQEYFRQKFALFIFNNNIKRINDGRNVTKTEYFCYTFNNILTDEYLQKDDIIYTLRHPNFDYYYQIQDIAFNHPDNLKTVENFINGKVILKNIYHKNGEKIVPINLKNIQEKNSLIQNYNEISYASSDVNNEKVFSRETIEPKILYDVPNNILDLIYLKNVLEQFKIEITCNADFAVQPGFIVSIVIPNSSIGNDISTGYNKYRSGRYLISKITTKINNNVPVQKLTLHRIDNIKPEIINKIYKK